MPTPPREARRSGALRKPKGWGPGFSMRYTVFASSNSKPIKIGSRTPTNAGTTRRTIGCGAAQRGSGAARLSASTTVLTKGSRRPQGSASGQVSWDVARRVIRKSGYRFSETITRQLKQANGRYPPSPVPAQGSTSHPGHNAGGLMPEAAREQGGIAPSAGTALAPPPESPLAGSVRIERALRAMYP
jgi:hypothetical protein